MGWSIGFGFRCNVWHAPGVEGEQSTRREGCIVKATTIAMDLGRQGRCLKAKAAIDLAAMICASAPSVNVADLLGHGGSACEPRPEDFRMAAEA